MNCLSVEGMLIGPVFKGSSMGIHGCPDFKTETVGVGELTQ